MDNSREYFPDPFNVEKFRGHIVDVVHKQSVERVASGVKPSDISDRNQAKIVLQRIEELVRAGILFDLSTKLKLLFPLTHLTLPLTL